MNDRELLTLAAKAAGIDYHIDRLDGCPKIIADGRVWNPLVFDGDALGLAAKLRISVDFNDCCAWSRGIFGLVQEFWGGDYPDCYRNAIVRAAAEIGMQKIA